MDVRCDRCSTEYDFDVTLVSDRGTTVECTTCGHQFQVFPAVGAPAEPERWAVQTDDGREFLFFSLRELQAGILSRKLTPDDHLTRGSSPPRPLAAIAELLPFFEEAKMYVVAPTARPRMITPAGLGMPTFSAGALPATELSSISSPSMDPPAALVSDPLTDVDADPPVTSRSSAAISETPRSGEMLPPPYFTPEADAEALRPSLVGNYESRPVASTPKRMSSSRSWPPTRSRKRRDWGMALLGLATLGFVGFLARPYVLSLIAGEDAPGDRSVMDGRVDLRFEAYVAAGQRALVDGDLESAKEAYDRANALRERDPAVVIALVRIAFLRADIPWLHLQMLPPEATTERTALAAEMQRRMTHAKRLVALAVALAPQDPAVVRVTVDAARLANDRALAQTLASTLMSPQEPTDPETAYVVAALALTDDAPTWELIVRCLRLAARAEITAGRAQAALVYALVRSGDHANARAEVVTMAMTTHPHPLLPALRTFVGLDAALPKTTSSAVSSTKPPESISSVKSNEHPRAPGEERKRRPRPAGEFSEDELQNHLDTKGSLTPAPTLRPLPSLAPDQ